MARQAGPSTDDHTEAAPSAATEGPGGQNASLRVAGVTGTLLALAAVVVLYGLVAVWPPAPPPPVTATIGPTTTTAAGQTTTPTTIAVPAAPNPPVRLFGWASGWSARPACSWWSPWRARSAAWSTRCGCWPGMRATGTSSTAGC